MSTMNCYIRRAKESLEIQMIFAIRERFPKARLKGNGEQPAKWRIVDGPKGPCNAWQESVDVAWAYAYVMTVETTETVTELIAKMRGGKK